MRPQGYGGFGSLQGQDDLGWNDMGDPHEAHAHDVEQPAFNPPVFNGGVPPVLMQREVLKEEFEPSFATPVLDPAMDDSFEDDSVEGHLEEDAPAFESVLAVKPLRTVEKLVAEQSVAEQPAPPEPAIAQAPAAAQVEDVVAEPAAPQPVTLPPARAARIARETRPKQGKAAFTLRLNHDRHLRLRLASALTNRSAQLLVTEALDAFLNTLPEVAVLANQLPPQAAR
ncbi:hypothetical protein [Sphingomonas sp. So64.6b]|uniref:hypothetical protein n=1 Tax=Sphingomonas sp. So64.6b TaxID=2997354 RepID=UPI00160220AC|nr:hypothetical protein [Sphingomonas sp. So64.6b]